MRICSFLNLSPLFKNHSQGINSLAWTLPIFCGFKSPDFESHFDSATESFLDHLHGSSKLLQFSNKRFWICSILFCLQCPRSGARTLTRVTSVTSVTYVTSWTSCSVSCSHLIKPGLLNRLVQHSGKTILWKSQQKKTKLCKDLWTSWNQRNAQQLFLKIFWTQENPSKQFISLSPIQTN